MWNALGTMRGLCHCLSLNYVAYKYEGGFKLHLPIL